MDSIDTSKLAEPKLRLRADGPSSSEAEIGERAEDLSVDPEVVRLLEQRGVKERNEQERVLRPRLSHLRSPDAVGAAMGGFSAAIDLLVDHVLRGSRVGVFGDYDVDGVTTAAILTSFLEEVGCEVVPRVATREGGYGFSVAVAKQFCEAKIDLVLTGDCGTSDHDALDYLYERKIPCAVIDHHQVPERMPNAAALINPHQPNCAFPFKGMCSAGVAFYLVAALRTALAKRGQTSNLPDPRSWLDLVALGTICDLVPLVDENRILVRHGLHELGARRRPGLRALLQRARIEGDVRIDEGHVGFQLGPRLNAPGRLASAEPALELLRARSSAEAEALAGEVESFNSQRQAYQQETVREALAQLQDDPKTNDRAALVVASPNWLPGVVGIAASGIVERYQKPTLAISLDMESGEARGSARSIEGVDVRAALLACGDLIRRGGGHRAAAGVSLDCDKVDAFREAFDAAVASQLESASGPSSELALEYDGAVALEQVTVPWITSIESGGPYGMAFPAPLYLCEQVKVRSTRIFKERHLSLKIEQAGHERELTFFGGAEEEIEKGDTISALFGVGVRTWGRRQSVQLRAQRIWKS